MSLLATKSWNPRSAKNRARVERDEREAKEAQNLNQSKARSMDAEWRYTQLKATAKDRGSEGDSKTEQVPISEARDEQAKKMTSKATSSTQSADYSPKHSVTGGTPLGGSHTQVKPWYESDGYAIQPRQNKDAVSRRDLHRMDPMTLMKHGEDPKKGNNSRKPQTLPNKMRDSPLDSSADKPTKLQLLREERLQRERAERERVNKMLHKPTFAHRRPEDRRYAPLRGKD